jgi:hypothetical protein
MRLWWALAAVALALPTGARAQTPGQPDAEGYALYDRAAKPLIAKSGVPSPEAAETPALGCQRYGQIAETIIRFALAASLTPGLSLDNPRAESRTQAADTMVDVAQNQLSQLAGAGATIEQCAAVARVYGAAAFSLARAINRANVEHNVDVVAGAVPPPPPPGKSAEELAAEAAAQADLERQVREQEEAERIAKDKEEHAFAHLGPIAPVPPRSQAQALAFNIYLIDTPGTREAKDFRMCFQPALYQRAAKPIVDLGSAALEVPELAAMIDQTQGDFFNALHTTLAKRFGFPADRLILELGEHAAVRGPVADPAKAVAEGCHIYLSPRPPTRAYDDTTTAFGLLAENVVEDVVTRPALELRLAALPKLETALRSPPAAPVARPAVVRCAEDARCHVGVALAINACLQAAERRYGKAAIARELEARQPVSAALNRDAYDQAANRDFDLISGNLELLDRELGRTLEQLLEDGVRLRRDASAVLSNQELDAVTTVGRGEGEQAMGAPALQCYSRIADGSGLALITPQ